MKTLRFVLAWLMDEPSDWLGWGYTGGDLKAWIWLTGIFVNAAPIIVALWIWIFRSDIHTPITIGRFLVWAGLLAAAMSLIAGLGSFGDNVGKDKTNKAVCIFARKGFGIPVILWPWVMPQRLWMPKKNPSGTIRIPDDYYHRWWSSRKLFWVSPWQQITITLAKLSPRTHRKISRESAAYLEIVREYKQQIITLFDEFMRAWCAVNVIIDQWNRWDYEEEEQNERQRESAAEQKIRDLICELQNRLTTIGWPYRNIADFDYLVWFQSGHIHQRRMIYYWDLLEKFLIARAK